MFNWLKWVFHNKSPWKSLVVWSVKLKEAFWAWLAQKSIFFGIYLFKSLFCHAHKICISGQSTGSSTKCIYFFIWKFSPLVFATPFFQVILLTTRQTDYKLHWKHDLLGRGKFYRKRQRERESRESMRPREKQNSGIETDRPEHARRQSWRRRTQGEGER